MSLDERTEQQLIALVGRVQDNETFKAGEPELNALESSLQAWVKLLVPVPSGKQTLSKDLYLKQQSSVLNVVDCNGGERTVRLPAANKGGKFYIIINASS